VGEQKRMTQKKMYMKSDGNGGFKISKGAIALISLLIVIMTFTATAAAQNASLKTTVLHNTKIMDECGMHIEDIKYQNAHRETDIAKLDTKIDNIEKDVSEMRADIQEILSRSAK